MVPSNNNILIIANASKAHHSDESIFSSLYHCRFRLLFCSFSSANVTVPRGNVLCFRCFIMMDGIVFTDAMFQARFFIGTITIVLMYGCFCLAVSLPFVECSGQFSFDESFHFQISIAQATVFFANNSEWLPFVLVAVLVGVFQFVRILLLVYAWVVWRMHPQRSSTCISVLRRLSKLDFVPIHMAVLSVGCLEQATLQIKLLDGFSFYMCVALLSIFGFHAHPKPSDGLKCVNDELIQNASGSKCINQSTRLILRRSLSADNISRESPLPYAAKVTVPFARHAMIQHDPAPPERVLFVESPPIPGHISFNALLRSAMLGITFSAFSVGYIRQLFVPLMQANVVWQQVYVSQSTQTYLDLLSIILRQGQVVLFCVEVLSVLVFPVIFFALSFYMFWLGIATSSKPQYKRLLWFISKIGCLPSSDTFALALFVELFAINAIPSLMATALPGVMAGFYMVIMAGVAVVDLDHHVLTELEDVRNISKSKQSFSYSLQSPDGSFGCGRPAHGLAMNCPGVPRHSAASCHDLAQETHQSSCESSSSRSLPKLVEKNILGRNGMNSQGTKSKLLARFSFQGGGVIFKVQGTR